MRIRVRRNSEYTSGFTMRPAVLKPFQIEDNNGPRHTDPPHTNVEDYLDRSPPSPPQHPLHDHHPWDHHHGVGDPGDPEEGDINHVEWHRGGTHFRSTTYRSPPITLGGPVGGGQPDMLSMVSQILGTLGPPMPGGPPGRGPPRQPGPPGQNGGPPGGGFRVGLTSPLQEGPPRHGHTRTFTASVGLQPRAGGHGPQPLAFPFEELQGRVPHNLIAIKS